MPVSRPPGPIRTKTFPPWGVLAIDLLGPLPINETISVVVDYYSRYYEINILRSTVASRVISSLQDMFSRHGLHESVAPTQWNTIHSNRVYRVYGTTRNKIPQGTRKMAPGERGRCLLKMIQICTCCKNCIKGRDKFLPCGLYQGFPHAATGPRVQLYYFLDGKFGQTL